MEKFINRTLSPLIKTSLTEKYISIILGPRQVGKTTLIEKIISELPGSSDTKSVFRLNFDDPQLRAQISSDPNHLPRLMETAFGKPLSKLTEKKYVFLDEVQKSPEVFDILKIIFDNHGEKIKIILTGSSSLNLLKKSSETLAGRVRLFHLSALSWKEILSENVFPLEGSLLGKLFAKSFSREIYLPFVSQIFSKREEVGYFFERYFISGGLPGIFTQNEDDFRLSATQSYLKTYLENDIGQLPQIKNEISFAETLNIFLINDSQLLNQTNLSSQIGIERPTLRNYLSVLENTFLLRRLRPFVKESKQSVKSPKLYFFDHALPLYARKIFSLEQLKASSSLGAIFENLCVNNIFSHFANDPKAPALNFWRDYGGHEIDLVVSFFDQIFPVEITYSSKLTRKKFNNFKAFYEAFPLAQNGFIFWSGDFEEIPVGTKTIFALPYWMMW